MEGDLEPVKVVHTYLARLRFKPSKQEKCQLLLTLMLPYTVSIKNTGVRTFSLRLL